MNDPALSFGPLVAFWCRCCGLEFRTRRVFAACPRCVSSLVEVDDVLEESA